MNTPAPGGESYSDLQKRLRLAIEEMEQMPYNHILVVTHGAALKTLLCTMLDIPLTKRSQFEIHNGSITKVERKKYQYNIIQVNRPTK